MAGLRLTSCRTPSVAGTRCCPMPMPSGTFLEVPGRIGVQAAAHQVVWPWGSNKPPPSELGSWESLRLKGLGIQAETLRKSQFPFTTRDGTHTWCPSAPILRPFQGKKKYTPSSSNGIQGFFKAGIPGGSQHPAQWFPKAAQLTPGLPQGGRWGGG